MRSVVAWIFALGAGCTNDLMQVKFVSASASGVGGHWFIGAERGETIELRFELDPADIPDVAGWAVKIDGPVGADTTVAMTGLHTVATVTIPPSTSDTFGRLVDETFTFHLLDPNGTVRESRQWAATIATNPGPEPRAWLWTSFWAADGERLLHPRTHCSSTMSIVTYVGGDLSAASKITVSVIDIDLVGADEVIDSATFTVQPERRMYETVFEDPCEGENGSDDSNNVDPKFTTTLFATDGREIDDIVGPELD